MKSLVTCVAMIHTLPPLLPLFSALAEEILPGVGVLHVLDEPLLAIISRRGRLDETDAVRLASHFAAARQAGAAAALVTCSTLSPLVPGLRGDAGFWVEAIDDAMTARAVRMGRRIGLLASNTSTLAPTRHLLQEQAAAAGTETVICEELVEGALDALLAGDVATHDMRVAAGARELAPQVDVLVLAQASMARALPLMADLPVPVLASPRSAIEALRARLSAG